MPYELIAAGTKIAMTSFPMPSKFQQNDSGATYKKYRIDKDIYCLFPDLL